MSQNILHTFVEYIEKSANFASGQTVPRVSHTSGDLTTDSQAGPPTPTPGSVISAKPTTPTNKPLNLSKSKANFTS